MKITLILIALMGCGQGLLHETGSHRGFVSDISLEGWICKTWEVQIMSGSGNSSIKYEFNVDNEEAFNKLKEAQEKQLEVNVHYKDYIMSGLCIGRYSSFIDKVDFIK